MQNILTGIVLHTRIYQYLCGEVKRTMRIISTRRIKEYYEREPRSRVALLYWVAVVKRAEWRNAMDVKRDFASVDAIGKQRFVFNIGGNKYRLIVVVQFAHQCVYVHFVGTHKEYDKVDCLTI